MTKRLEFVGARLTDEERSRLEALGLAFGLDQSGVIRMALDHLHHAIGGVTAPRQPDGER